MSGGGSRSEMDDEQFDRWAELIESRTGMRLPPERKSFLVTSLGMRMREIGLSDYESYYDALHSGRAGTIEWSTLVDRLVVNETRFFRHRPSLELIRDRYLPGLEAPAGEPLRVQAWSVGCATGEEPYSLAILLHHSLRARADSAYFGVIGTDISASALAVARRGDYPDNRTRELPADLRDAYLEPAGPGRWEVERSLRQRVCFARMNVLGEQYAPAGLMDIVYCQNLLIYFDRPRRIEIVDRLAARLRPGGLLVLAPGEIVGWTPGGLERMGGDEVLAFRRTAPGSGER